MAFDLASAKPVSQGFDLASAKPVAAASAEADVTPPPTFGNTLLGEAQLLGSGIANIPHAAAHAAVRLTRRMTGGDTNAPDPEIVDKGLLRQHGVGDAGKNLIENVRKVLPSTPNGLDVSDAELRSLDPTGKIPIEQLRAQYKPEGDKPLTQMLDESGTVSGDLLSGGLKVGGDVGAITGAANLPKAVMNVASDIRNAASGIRSAMKGTAGDVEDLATPTWKKAGLRTAENNPIARNVAGQSGREALTLHNRPVVNTIATNEAGAAAGKPLTVESLKDGRVAPDAVYGRVEKALPTGGLDKEAAAGIRSAGTPEGGRITKGSPAAQQQIEELRTQLLDPDRQFTGQQMVNELRGLRQEGFANSASEDVSNQQLGRAQLDMARALEGHIGRNLPSGGNVSIEQFQAARKALAKNFTVQSALRGNDVDPQALARIARNEPELLDGGLKTLSEFANEHPEVASLPSPTARYNPPGVARDFSDVDLKKPLTYVQPLTGAAARRVLTGSPEDALAQANAAFPPRDPRQFAPIPKPPIAGLLEAPKPPPTMVNAGGGAATPQALNDLGLTPDVQNAAAAHPGAPRPGAPIPAPPGAPAPVEFQPPGNWSSVLQPNGPVPPSAPRTPASMYADVLSQGVEKPAPPGLSLADMGVPKMEGIPFERNAAHEAGDLQLAPEDAWFKPGQQSKLKQYAHVLSQGVPEDIMARTAPRSPTTNNASGESAASVEAINRGTRPLAMIDPDGKEHVLLRDVTQIDRKAPKGSLIIDTSTGEIIDRGGLSKELASGLRNRWAALESTTARQRLMAQALRN